MSVGGTGMSQGSPAEGSGADLAQVIKSEDAYQARLAELQRRYAALDAKIALAGAAEDMVRLRREVQHLQNQAQQDRDAAAKAKADAEAELTAARTVAADTLARAEREAAAKAKEIVGDAKAEAHALAQKIVADAKAEAAAAKAEYAEKVEKLKAAIGYP